MVTTINFHVYAVFWRGPNLAQQECYSTNEMRVINREDLEKILVEMLTHLPRNKVLGDLEAAGVPCGPINSISDVFADPHVQHLGMRVELQREDGTVVPTSAFPVKMSETPASYRQAPPSLGTATETILVQIVA